MARVFREVGPDRLIAPKNLRLRSVRIHSPETDAAPERLVRVFPAAEKNAAVREDRGEIVGLVVARDDVKVRRIELHAREDKRVSRRHAADVGVAARRRKDKMLTVGQIDGVDVVESAARELTQARPVDSDLVDMERFFVMRFEREKNLLGVVGKVGTPERSAERFRGREFSLLAARTEPFTRHEPSAGRGHIAEPMPRFVRPFAPLRIGRVDVKNRIEVERRIAHKDGAFKSSRFEVQVGHAREVGHGAARGFRGVGVDLRAKFRQFFFFGVKFGVFFVFFYERFDASEFELYTRFTQARAVLNFF